MLGYEKPQLEDLKALFTAEEICQQPDTWLKTLKQIYDDKERIIEFITRVTKADDFDIIFTGAGTSEFIGNTLFSSLNKKYDYKVKSYATTELVVAPELFIAPEKPTLLISFGRSGSSPESLGAIEACNAVAKNIYHLFITCNPQGEMAKWKSKKDNCLALILTPETCDRGFAMTSSFSNMLLAAYLCLNLDENLETEVKEAAAKAGKLLEEGYQQIQGLIAEYPFDRIVYLGSNSLKGLAQESALKMLELTQGKVVTMFDSPLGFRHGPKSILTDKTLTVFYLSQDEYTRRYEIDLIKEMAGQRNGNRIMAIADKVDQETTALTDHHYSFDNDKNLNSLLIGLEYITFAQTLALFKSLALDFTPDNPCPTGEVNRVVQGVTIYPYKK